MTEEQKKEIGTQIRAIRENKKKTLTKVAADVGISISTLCKVESGKWANADMYRRIGEVLGFEVEESLRLRIK